MKIGFMGGTFSPPHKGHLHSARVFIDEMCLDRLIIIPAKVSPFKVGANATAGETDRLEMSKLCFLPLDSKKCVVEVSDTEICKNQTSYTIETIRELEKLYPKDELYMFVGSDMFLSLERWKDSDSIFEKCHIYTRCRDIGELDRMLSTKERYRDLFGADITISKDKEIIVSSTEIRHALMAKNHENARNLLTDEVLEYIIKNRLYNQENYEQ